MIWIRLAIAIIVYLQVALA